MVIVLKQSKQKFRFPLRLYLAAGFLIFSVLLLTVLWLFQTVFLETFYKSVKTGQVKDCANSVADNIEASNLSDLITDLEEQNSMTVAIFNTDSNIFTTVYSSKNPYQHFKLEMSVVYDLYQKAKDNDCEYSTITQTGSERRFFPHKDGEDATLPTDRQDGGNNGNNWDPHNNGEGGMNPSEGDPPPPMPSDGSEIPPNASENGPMPQIPSENSPLPPQNPTESGSSIPDSTRPDPSQTAPNAGAIGMGGFALVASDTTVQDETQADQQSDAEPINKLEPSLERENVETLAYVKVVNTSSGERLVIVESEITPVSSVVDTLRYQLIIMTVVLVALSVIVAIFIANMIAKPISNTNEKAKALARRNYDLLFTGGRYREIKELNATLTYAADELKKVDNLQKELIANISHDLRTPLTMITGYSEVMRDLPGEVTPENIQIIIDEATRLNNLVTDLLDISRLQSGTADIKRAPFSLTNCILSIFARYTKLIENDGLNIVFEHEGEVFVNGDELRMTQVLYNLINNAINYIGDDKTVLVRQTVEDGRVRIEVIDHGDGIPEEKLEYIWDRYYRVDKEHRRAVIGTGLGLSIVKNILIAHDADFGVASKLGEGSDFYFSMPIINTEEE